jgi:predicted ATP-grasp superfamily ATP-dependent carboligase
VLKQLIIAAPSARGYAQAAAACDYGVIALDAFVDGDTRLVATQSFQVKMTDFALDKADFKRLFVEITSSIHLGEVEGFLYGSLFDNAPELLAWVAERVRLIGNAPEAMQAAKSLEFFKLLDKLGIRHPEVHLELPENTTSWLSKRFGGTGGMHIQLATLDDSGDYFQRKIDGKPISMLFVADGKTTRLIGFNEQFVAPIVDMPYRFAGAVGGVVLSKNVQQQFCHAAQQLTAALGLRGINSLDAILQDETLWILELNPRLSATFHLYPNLLPAHIQGCAGELIDIDLQANTSNAQLIIYAADNVNISANFAWPSWVADIPAVNTADSSVIIQKDAPICTVQATAKDAESAHKLVLQRATELREMFNDKTRYSQH